jgi:hypothetical protein
MTYLSGTVLSYHCSRWWTNLHVATPGVLIFMQCGSNLIFNMTITFTTNYFFGDNETIIVTS